MSDQVSAYRWMIAWIVILVLMIGFNKLKFGHAILYYLLVLTLVVMLLTQYQALAWALSPFSRSNTNG